MKVTKILILAASALALQGCVSYSNPYEPTGRVEFRGEAARDDYAYDAGEPIVDLRIADAAYYPWWSIDYYYLGHHYYRPAYLGGLHHSFAYGYGVPPYYWPYYGFYSPFYYPYSSYAWYDPWYGWPRYGIGLNIIWYDGFWARRYQDHWRDHYYPGYHEYGNSRYGYQLSRDEVLIDARDRAYPGDRLLGRDAQPISRNVWTAPSLGDAESGMEVRSRRERKIQESHIGPAPVQAPSAPLPSARVISDAPSQPSIPVLSAPGMMRQVQPSQARPSAPPRQTTSPAPVVSEPRMIRQTQPPQARPSAPPRSAPSTPAPIRGPSDSGSSPPSKSGDRRQN